MAASTLAAHNIKQLNLSASAKMIWSWSSFGASGLTAWARVEGKRHNPSDVLFGYALGHFIADFLNSAFVTPPDKNTLVFTTEPLTKDGFVLTVRYKF